MTVTRQDFEAAIAAYWGAKELQREQSAIKNAVGAGTAGSVRGGKHFDAIATLLAKFFLDTGYPSASIRVTKSQGLELPGYYRPQKQWDLVVVHEDVLVAAFELKALGGPSYGNNYNNRVEEALGSAVDLRRAALAELYPKEKPWLGYFFVMQDGEESRRPVKTTRGALPVDGIWHGTSYQDRFGIFCERLMAERLYDAVCYVTSSAEDPKPTEPVESLDWRHFSAAINARLTYLKDLGIPG
ncbi:PaeR7I family type II restriction endonuclease [Streptomyces somaliensis DSM 40738]|uniref:Type II site-specific deoxyribonuclease n=1 Tax=Streptomyces somaliensis (strain ATCC 33201 / DSM 40738 / JCM 12659 / KCTC 9044 / NCTC 11332 / NRRL B-12077 / IP 733) TaxID=1134445 RepID=A0AA44DEU7_STRE0|nr:PaeR7I family type II restriction endonuclease [Streptomyces somaliensis]MCQ0023037.1 PaeR7I family type II restriction endonuclease [Streptomyces somaliensis DSM 40738]NKY14937.1 type II site-specific deoxyribonuclease [Streptomyces somaliensis DSM 40738]